MNGLGRLVASERPGTRSLSRLVKLMRLIAARPQFGWRLSDLASASELDRGTVHRMLACLVEERLVEQRADDRHYLPGPLMYELGLALPNRLHFQRRAETLAVPLSRSLGGVVVVLLRSGNEGVCAVRCGSLPLKGSVLYPGTRRPLFTMASGVSILQTLPASEAHDVLLDNVTQEVARHGRSRLQALQRMRERSDRHGFGVNLGDVVPGIHAFGVPISDSRGEAFAAVGLLGTPQQHGETHLGTIRDALLATAQTLSAEACRLEL